MCSEKNKIPCLQVVALAFALTGFVSLIIAQIMLGLGGYDNIFFGAILSLILGGALAYATTFGLAGGPWLDDRAVKIGIFLGVLSGQLTFGWHYPPSTELTRLCLVWTLGITMDVCVTSAFLELVEHYRRQLKQSLQVQEEQT